jgi:hypothetical protein
MGLIYYQRISFQTERNPENISRVFSDIINDRRINEEIKKLLSHDWNVSIYFNDIRFGITINRNVPWHARAGIGSVLKGKIQQNKMTRQTKIIAVVRPSNQHIFSVAIFFLFLTTVLLYAISNKLTSVVAISSILLFASYLGFLIDFNSQVESYKRIIHCSFD